MKDRLNAALKEILAQAKKADGLVNELKSKIAKIDKETAKASLAQIKTVGSAEVKRLRERLQNQLVTLSDDLAKTSGKLMTESEKVRGRVQKTLATVKTQIKVITEAERNKRRGRRRSE